VEFENNGLSLQKKSYMHLKEVITILCEKKVLYVEDTFINQNNFQLGHKNIRTKFIFWQSIKIILMRFV